MTEQEAAAFAEKLRVVWGTKGGDQDKWDLDEHAFTFGGWVSIGDALAVHLYKNRNGNTCELTRDYSCWLKVDRDLNIYSTASLFSEEERWYHEEFERGHMQEFRKRVWLSGIPIECTATEQVEWHLWLQEQMEALS